MQLYKHAPNCCFNRPIAYVSISFADYRYVRHVRPHYYPLLHNVSLCMQVIDLVTVTCEAVLR
jgi:hypothetical protein